MHFFFLLKVAASLHERGSFSPREEIGRDRAISHQKHDFNCSKRLQTSQ